MKLGYLALLSIAVFLLSTMLSTSLVQVQTRALTETRRSALVGNLGRSRFEKGNHAPYLLFNDSTEDATSAAEVLTILKTIDGLGAVDAEKGLTYIVSRQNLTVGNKTLWGWPLRLAGTDSAYGSDLYHPFVITSSLKLLSAVNQLNIGTLVDFVMERYNETEGAFHEPVMEVDRGHGIQPYTCCDFPLEFRTSPDVAYANSNIISTFLALATLSNLGAMDRVNVTRTALWILSCRADNGGFKPFPEAQHEYLPGWSSLTTNPFYVDSHGAGIAYTYAAVGALNALSVKLSDVVDAGEAKRYVLSCLQLYSGGTARFRAHPEDKGTPDFGLTYYGMKTLQYLDALGEEQETVSRVTAYLLRWLQDPDLLHTDPTSGFYGLFNDFTPLRTTYFSAEILNATDSLHLLDQLTPRATSTWHNLLGLSAIASVSTFGLSTASLLTYRKIRAWKQKLREPKDKPESGSTPTQ